MLVPIDGRDGSYDEKSRGSGQHERTVPGVILEIGLEWFMLRNPL